MEFIPHQESIINNPKLNMSEHIKSFLITFMVAFAMVFVADIDKLTLATLSDGVLFGLVFAGIRAGVKAVLQLVIDRYSSK